MEKEKRIEVVEEKIGFTEGYKIIVDNKTGVNYLFYKEGYGAGLTILVDKDGKPIITK